MPARVELSRRRLLLQLSFLEVVFASCNNSPQIRTVKNKIEPTASSTVLNKIENPAKGEAIVERSSTAVVFAKPSPRPTIESVNKISKDDIPELNRAESPPKSTPTNTELLPPRHRTLWEQDYNPPDASQKYWPLTILPPFYIISDNKFYLYDQSGFIKSQNSLTGKSNWISKTKGYLLNHDGINSERLYIIDLDRNIVCLNSDNGSVLWKIKPPIEGNLILGSSFTTNDALSLTLKSSDGIFQTISIYKKDGRIFWKKDIELSHFSFDSALVTLDGKYIDSVTGVEIANLKKIDPMAPDIIRWNAPLGINFSNYYFTTIGPETFLVGVDRSTGTKKFKVKVPTNNEYMEISYRNEELVFVADFSGLGDREKLLYCYTSNGFLIWTFKLEFNSRPYLSMYENYLYINESNNHTHNFSKIDPKTGKIIWKTKDVFIIDTVVSFEIKGFQNWGVTVPRVWIRSGDKNQIQKPYLIHGINLANGVKTWSANIADIGYTSGPFETHLYIREGPKTRILNITNGKSDETSLPEGDKYFLNSDKVIFICSANYGKAGKISVHQKL